MKVRVILSLTLALCTATPWQVYASKCATGKNVINDVWDKYDALARATGCAHPVPGPLRFVACEIMRAAGAPIKLGDKMIGWWDSMAQGGWATIGPRMLGPDWEKGTLQGTSGRTFIATAPTNTDKVTLEVNKRDGRAETEVTVCATRQGGEPQEIDTFRFDNGTGNIGRTITRQYRNLEDAILSVHLDAKSLAHSFAYQVRLTPEPIHVDTSPVRGFADLHVHQAVELAHGGLMYHGSHTGPADKALDHCNFTQHGLPFALNPLLRCLHGDGNPGFQNWPDHTDVCHTQTHESWLKQAHDNGLALVVVSAVNSEVLCRALSIGLVKSSLTCRDMDNLDRQVDAFIEFDRTHDWYEIALDPWHARQIIHQGKLAVVVSLEASHLFPASDGDFVDQLDKMYAKGVRTLQSTHETDGRFAGAAPHNDLLETAQLIKHPTFSGAVSLLKSALGPEKLEGFQYETRSRDGEPAARWNSVGLKEEGKRLTDAMVARHMLIDMAHMSTKSTEELFDYVATKHAYYPLYQSHSRFRALLRAEDRDHQQELGTTFSQRDMVRRTGGMIGLRTGPEAMLTSEYGSLDNECHGTTHSFKRMIEYADEHDVALAFGSDLSGNIAQMGPRFALQPPDQSTACPGGGVPDTGSLPAGVSQEFDTHGLRHAGLLPDVVADLKALGTRRTAIARLENSAEAFLKMWERAYDTNRRDLGAVTVRRPTAQ